jgi:hypothetical protein
MNKKARLTIEGLNQIQIIKKGINKNRIHPSAEGAEVSEGTQN